MPIYEWACPRCSVRKETIQKHRDSAPSCQSCSLDAGGPVEMKRQISRSSFVLKGNGWASDGYEG